MINVLWLQKGNKKSTLAINLSGFLIDVVIVIIVAVVVVVFVG